MCNRYIQDDTEIRPGQRTRVLMRGPGGEFEVDFKEAVFGGPAKRESRGYWIKKEGAEDVRVPNVSRFGEKSKTTGQQGWEDVTPASSLEGLLLPQPPGKDYRLLKIVTQPATPEQLASLGNDRAPVVIPPAQPSTAVYVPKAQPGQRVKLKQPENTYSLPDGLHDGEEVLVVGAWDHSFYTVEKDGKEYRVSHMCLDLPLLPWPPRKDAV